MKRNIFIIIFIAAVTSCTPTQIKIDEKNAKDPKYQYDLAKQSMKYTLYDEALKYTKISTSLDPTFYEAWNLMGLAFCYKSDIENAAISYRKAFQIKPDFSEAHYNLGIVLEQSGKVSEAMAEFEKAFSIDENYNAAYEIAKLYYDQKKYDLSQEFVEKSINKFSANVYSQNLLGCIFNVLGKYDEAITVFKKALALAPDKVEVNVNLAIAYLNKKDPDKGRAILIKLLSKTTDPSIKKQINELLEKFK